ncbi:MAG: hypoxanthine phosphoribosyltransferase [Deltaproteobacteria bacterium]|nr:hypoxanthine phosphoribosyltransferase [Deltaproteobacteria bacterium]
MDITETIISREQIHDRVDVLGRQISADYRNKELVLIGILNGAFIFLADLVRSIDLELEVDFIRVASYGDATSTTGTITLSKKPELDLTGKDILLVEDIVDTGTTLTWLLDYIATYQPASIKTCTLIDKHERRETEVNVDYVGFMLNKGFLVGYGLDYAQKFRNLPEVCSMKE